MSNEVSVRKQFDMFDDKMVESVKVFSKLMAQGSSSIPKFYQNNPGDCFAICIQAAGWGMQPHAVASKTYQAPGGKIAYEAQLISAVVNTNAPLQQRLKFTWSEPKGWDKILGRVKTVTGNSGKSYQVRNWTDQDETGLWCECSGLLIGEDKPRVVRLHMRQCPVRNSTLWTHDPMQQLAYAATQKWARLYCSDVILGVNSADDPTEEVVEIDITPVSTVVSEDTPKKQGERKPRGKKAVQNTKKTEEVKKDDDNNAPGRNNKKIHTEPETQASEEKREEVKKNEADKAIKKSESSSKTKATTKTKIPHENDPRRLEMTGIAEMMSETSSVDELIQLTAYVASLDSGEGDQESDRQKTVLFEQYEEEMKRLSS